MRAGFVHRDHPTGSGGAVVRLVLHRHQGAPPSRAYACPVVLFYRPLVVGLVADDRQHPLRVFIPRGYALGGATNIGWGRHRAWADRYARVVVRR
jgi:hypothetical protein